MIHFAVNVINEGTPVKTLALSDLDVKPSQFIENLLQRFKDETESIVAATQKVHWVK